MIYTIYEVQKSIVNNVYHKRDLHYLKLIMEPATQDAFVGLEIKHITGFWDQLFPNPIWLGDSSFKNRKMSSGSELSTSCAYVTWNTLYILESVIDSLPTDLIQTSLITFTELT